MISSTRSNRTDRLEAMRAQRREYRGREWVWGFRLILVAIFMLVRNLDIDTLQNPWALFILLPALGMFALAWRTAHAAGGQFCRRARGAFIGSLLLVLTTVICLFNLNWIYFGPLLLVLTGLGLTANALLP